MIYVNDWVKPNMTNTASDIDNEYNIALDFIEYDTRWI